MNLCNVQNMRLCTAEQQADEKSDAMLAEALRQVNVPNYRGIIFRDTTKQLEGLISRSNDLYSKAFPDAKYNDNKLQWKFGSGAKIFFGYMEHEADKLNYQGKSIRLCRI